MKSISSLRNIIIVLSVVVVVLFTAHYFLYRDIRIKNENVSISEHELALQGSRQDYLIFTERLIQSISPDIQAVDSSIVAKDADVQFIESLETVAKNNNLKIGIDSLVIADDPSFQTSNVSSLTVKAKTTGSWVGMYSFLSELESLPFKVRINRFAITNVSLDTGADVRKTGQVWQGVFEIVVLKYK